MSLKQSDVFALFARAGIPLGSCRLLDSTFESISLERLREIASALLDALPPELVVVRDVGGVPCRTPRWVPEAGDCETHSFVLFAWCLVGNWVRAVRDGVDRGGLACGPIIYTAVPRLQNEFRSGRHSIMWHVDHSGVLCFFDFGINAPTELLPSELASITDIYGA